MARKLHSVARLRSPAQPARCGMCTLSGSCGPRCCKKYIYSVTIQWGHEGTEQSPNPQMLLNHTSQGDPNISQKEGSSGKLLLGIRPYPRVPAVSRPRVAAVSILSASLQVLGSADAKWPRFFPGSGKEYSPLSSGQDRQPWIEGEAR